ncbi:FprA family A-type flavoprotein [Desulfogranum marinum]|uniref:FprA family A-type flavoprotein n=1 Tax=Desulfogranum marinum TaxID=453220 RepID=UPI0019660F20|nr:FprA family A-type flavoprotein [Desulfogranum marinum]MBM9514400.1 FprA family A-type flavoprotein [Desulfogranum marinum]
MNCTQMSDQVFQLKVNIEEDGYLFEGLWPVPNGVSINSYLIKGDKTAIIDLTQDIYELTSSLEQQMEQTGVNIEEIDYVIVNHMEPDHSGMLRAFVEKNTTCRIVCSAKAAPLLEQFSSVPMGRVDIVGDGDTLDLGDGMVLRFFMIPNVHWPETMATYLESEKILFPCDAFGSYGAVKEQAFDDQLSDERVAFFEQESLRYYANIVATFSPFVEKAIEKLSSLPIDAIAPSHGIVWRKNPSAIINHYKRYASYAKGPAEPEVCLIWASMYGNTGKTIAPLIKGIKSEGVEVRTFRVPQDDLGHILAAAWRAAGLVFAMPTYEYKMFPPMAQVIEDLMIKKVKNRKVLRVGSYGWVGGAEKDFRTRTEKAGWDIMDSIEFQGAPGDEDLEAMEQAGKELAQKIKQFCSK